MSVPEWSRKDYTDPDWRKKGYADPNATFDTCPGFESWWEGMPLEHWYCKHCGGVLQKHKLPSLIDQGAQP